MEINENNKKYNFYSIIIINKTKIFDYLLIKSDTFF